MFVRRLGDIEIIEIKTLQLNSAMFTAEQGNYLPLSYNHQYIVNQGSTSWFFLAPGRSGAG